MNILVSGTVKQLNEFEKNFMNDSSENRVKSQATYRLNQGILTEEDFINKPDIVFDLNFDDDTNRFKHYSTKNGVVFFLSATKVRLSDLLKKHTGSSCILYGLNCLPGFINNKLLEVTIPDAKFENKLNLLASELGFKYQKVKDQAGMVTPRIICMIINEAYFMLEEGTATRDDIDKAMKLGTNYPYGPFEWANRIGVKNVCDILKAVFDETGNVKYRINKLLEQSHGL